MERTPSELNEHLGTAGWIGITAVALAFDLVSSETLSQASNRAFRRHPVLTGSALLVTNAHLMGLLPERVDPFSAFLRVAKAL